MDKNNAPLFNSSALTGLIISFAQFGIELEDRTRIFLLKELIDVHQTHNIDEFSDSVILKVKEIIKNLEA